MEDSLLLLFNLNEYHQSTFNEETAERNKEKKIKERKCVLKVMKNAEN